MNGRIIVLTAAALLCAPALHAQLPVSVSSSVSFRSGYEARGLTMSEAPVVQAALDVGGQAAAFDVFVGAWANVEPYESTTRRRMLPAGVSGPSEVNLYAGASREVGALGLEAGVIRFLFPHGFDFSSPSPITELYGSVAVAAPGEPTLSAYYDLAASGWYTELAASHELPLGGAFVRLGAELGASFGQADADEYYDADGLTHAGLSSGFVWKLGSLVVGPEVRWTWAFDDAAVLGHTSTHRGRRSKGVVALTVEWSAGGR